MASNNIHCHSCGKLIYEKNFIRHIKIHSCDTSFGGGDDFRLDEMTNSKLISYIRLQNANLDADVQKVKHYTSCLTKDIISHLSKVDSGDPLDLSEIHKIYTKTMLEHDDSETQTDPNEHVIHRLIY